MPTLNLRFHARNADGSVNLEIPAGPGLHQAGPRVQVTITPLQDQLKTLAEQGESAPNPVTGVALIDTGAYSTCFDREAAAQAKLAMVGSAPMTSATHANETVPVYAGLLSIPDLGGFQTLKALGANLAPQGLIALIGRDALMSCVLVYNGVDASFCISR